MRKLLVLPLLIVTLLLISCGNSTENTESQSELVTGYGTVQKDGDSLIPLLDGKTYSDDADVLVDPDFPVIIPTLAFTHPDGTISTINASSGKPKIIFLVGHWCPHCDAELEDLAKLLKESGDTGIETHIIFTTTDPEKANYPPQDWFATYGFEEGSVITHYDNESWDAATALGFSGQVPYTLITSDKGVPQFRALGNAGEEGLNDIYLNVANLFG